MELTNWVVAAAVVAQAAYAALTYHRDRKAVMQNNPATQPRRPIVIIGIFMLLTWAAVGFDYLNRPAAPEAQLVSYGVSGPKELVAIAQLAKWQNYRDYKGVLITRTVYADRDRMTDDWIAKSIGYTIDGPNIALAAITNNQMRFTLGTTNFIEYNFVVIPQDKSPDQIRSLGDVSRLGGRILATMAQGVPFPAAEAPNH